MAGETRTFGTAFREARNAGQSDFEWKGKIYTTRTAQEATTPTYQPSLMPGGAPVVTPQTPVNMASPPASIGFPPMAAGSPGTGVDVMAPPAGIQAPQAGGFDLLSGAQDNSWNVGAPKTPEERADRVSGWQEFFSQVQQNPNLLMAIMRMGTQLMQPIAPGQSVGGHFGNALAGSVDYLNSLNMGQQKMGLETARTQADIEQSKAATEASRSGVQMASRADARAEKQLSSQLKLIDQQLKGATTQYELAQIQKRVAEFKANPQYMEQLQSKEMLELDTRMKAEQGRIAAYQAALARAQQEGKALTAAERKLQAEEDASIEYVNQVDQGIRDLAAQLSAKRKKEVPFELAREEFFSDKPTLADHYWKYVGLAAKRQKKASEEKGKPGTPGTTPPAKPAAPQTPEQLQERTRGQSDFTIIKQPDGSLKTVPTRSLNLPGSQTYEPIELPFQ